MRRSVLALAVVATACGSVAEAPHGKTPPYPPGSLKALRGDAPLTPRIASYRIDARLDIDKKQIVASQRLTWRHTGKRPLAELAFHLYMNAFKNEGTVFMRESGGQHRSARANPDSWGWIDVPSIKLGDRELRATARFGEDETTLFVPIPEGIAPGATVELDFQFTVQLPEVFARTGWKGDFIMVGQWFPKVGVLVSDPQAGDQDNETMYCHTFHLNSEFFADFGSYDVTLDVPAEHTIAATGVLVGETREGARKKLVYRAEDVHDFAWMADPHMRVSQTRTKDGVVVLVYHRPGQTAFAGRHLEAARRTIEVFSRLFYPYPWTVMTVIDPPPDAGESAGGMEYPTLVTTSADSVFFPEGVPVPEFVTIHEVGHNWFQGIFASNEAEEAWLDEGINEYADGIVLAEWYGEDRSMLNWGGLALDVYDAHRFTYDPDDDVSPITTRSWEFATFNSYSEATYTKTLLALKTVENMVGKERFFAALGLYGQRFAFQHPTKEDFFTALSDGLGGDLRWFLGPAFESAAAVDLQLGPMRTRRKHAPRGVFGEGEQRKTVDKDGAPDDGWVSEVTVLNPGVPVEVDVLFRFEDGTEQRERWDDRASHRRFVVESKAPLVEVEIDPEHVVLLEKERLDNARRLAPSAQGAWRAAARASFWEQTLMQLGGF